MGFVIFALLAFGLMLVHHFYFDAPVHVPPGTKPKPHRGRDRSEPVELRGQADDCDSGGDGG
ncbi:MAG: hypothetical protein K8U03_01370 [Planctomycetia bacterium]|nr:hypothetical protein [Planctomycetia bacterium]